MWLNPSGAILVGRYMRQECAILKKTTIVYIFLFFVFLSPSCCSQEKGSSVREKEDRPDLTLITNGDLVFRQGTGIFSYLCRNIGGEPSTFSHVGIVYFENNKAFVIHTEANDLTGIGFAKKEELSIFISASNSSKHAFYRVQNLSSNQIEGVLDSAFKYVSDSIPFDTDFDLTNDHKLYCTELVYKAFKSIGCKLVRMHRKIDAQYVSRSKAFEVITIGQLLSSKKVKLIQYDRKGE
jgi:hypothetical protein